MPRAKSPGFRKEHGCKNETQKVIAGGGRIGKENISQIAGSGADAVCGSRFFLCDSNNNRSGK